MRQFNRADAATLLFLLALFVYVVIRSVLVTITNDEAYSFYIVKNFWYAEALCTGNTHWLNSLAIKLAVLSKLEEPWHIRWLSILSALGILCLAFSWLRSVKEPALRVVILALLLNPYILDYLGLARGYAPGLLLQCLSLWFFFRWHNDKDLRFSFYSLLLAGLCPLANFSFVYFFMAMTLVYFSLIYFKNFTDSLRSLVFYRDSFYVAGISFLIYRAFLFMTRCSNDVVGAGTRSFTEYFYVLPHGLMPALDINENTLHVLGILAFMLLLSSVVAGLFSKNTKQNRVYYFSALFLLIMLGTTLINGFLFKIVFPFYRSAVFLFPTSLICFVCFLDKLIKNGALRKIILYGLSALLFINFTLSLNLRYVFDYHSQADSKESFDLLEELGAKKAAMSREVYGVFRNYYQVKQHPSYSFSAEMLIEKETGKAGEHKKRITDFEYLLLVPPYQVNLQTSSGIILKPVKFFPETGSIILKVDQ